MQAAIDVTGLTPEQEEAVERGKIPVRINKDGIATPVLPKSQGGTIKVKKTQANKRMEKKYGPDIFMSDGKINYKRIPVDDLLQKISKKKGDARTNFLEILGKNLCIKLMSKLPQSELKLKTKKEIKRKICSHYDIVDKASKKTKKDKLKKKHSKKDLEREIDEVMAGPAVK